MMYCQSCQRVSHNSLENHLLRLFLQYLPSSPNQTTKYVLYFTSTLSFRNIKHVSLCKFQVTQYKETTQKKPIQMEIEGICCEQILRVEKPIQLVWRYMLQKNDRQEFLTEYGLKIWLSSNVSAVMVDILMKMKHLETATRFESSNTTIDLFMAKDTEIFITVMLQTTKYKSIQLKYKQVQCTWQGKGVFSYHNEFSLNYYRCRQVTTKMFQRNNNN